NRSGGRPANRYQLLVDGREEILRRLVEVRKAATIDQTHASQVAQPELSSGPAEDFTPLALLESALDALADGDFASGQERSELLEDARISLIGAQADFRAMIARGADPTEVERFGAKLSLARTRLAGADHGRPPVEPARIVVPPEETSSD